MRFKDFLFQTYPSHINFMISPMMEKEFLIEPELTQRT